MTSPLRGFAHKQGFLVAAWEIFLMISLISIYYALVVYRKLT
jgi:hypothetical protein